MPDQEPPGDQGPRDSLNEPRVPADEVDRFEADRFDAGRGDGHGGDPESPFAPGEGGEGEVESWHQGTPPSR